MRLAFGCGEIATGSALGPALYIILRYGTDSRAPIGLVIKWGGFRLWSERRDRRRGLTLGPLYVRTYGRIA